MNKLIRKIKAVFQSQNNASKKGFSNFIRNSTREEKQQIFERVMKRSNKDQRKILGM